MFSVSLGWRGVLALKSGIIGAALGVAFLSTPAMAQSNGSCNGSVKTATFSGGGISINQVGGDMLATEFVDFSILSGDFEGGNAQLIIRVTEPGQSQMQFCSGLACDGMRFTATQDGNHAIEIQGRTEDGAQGQVRAACTAASTGPDDDDDDQGGDDQGGEGGDDQGRGDSPYPREEIAAFIQDVLSQVHRAMNLDAATITAMAANHGLFLNRGLTDVTSQVAGGLASEDAGTKLLADMGQNRAAIGFETKLSALGDSGARAVGTGSALMGNVRFYGFDGELDGDAWQGQLGYRHALGETRSVTVFGTYRKVDVDAGNFGFALDEDSYGAGLIFQGALSENVTATASIAYETGDADITIGAATGNTDTNRLSGAIGFYSEYAVDSLTLSPRLVGGLVSLEHDAYRDSAATLIPGRDTTDRFAELGVRMAPATVAEGGLAWFLDASADYAGETLDGARTLSGRVISDNHLAANAEAGVQFDLQNGAALTLSGGGRGWGRETHALFGNALLTVPLN